MPGGESPCRHLLASCRYQKHPLEPHHYRSLIQLGMPGKKHVKRRIAKHKWKGRKPFESKSALNEPLDTRRIPWFSDVQSTRRTTGTDD